VIDTDHISDLRIDRLLADELSAAESDATRLHAAGCARCGARLREIEAERGAFVLRPAAVDFHPARRRPRWLGWFAAPLAALAAAAVLVLVLRPRGDDGDPERRKGSGAAALLLSAGTPDRLAPLRDRDTLHAGDHLQAGYTASVDGYGAVISVDGAGQTTTYVPPTGDALVALPAGTERSFPGSTVLDDVLGTERIAIVWCTTARPLAPLVDELRTTQTITARDGCTIRVVVLTKVAPR